MFLGTHVRRPKDDPAPATVLYHPGRKNPSGDIRHACQTSVTTPQPRDLVRIVHAILKGQDRSVPTHEGRQSPRRLFSVLRLDGKEDQVNRGNLIRAGNERRMYFQVFLNASYPQAMLLHRLEMFAAGDEGHIHAGGRQASPEILSDGACPHHRDSHVPFPLAFSVVTISPEAPLAGLCRQDIASASPGGHCQQARCAGPSVARAPTYPSPGASATSRQRAAAAGSSRVASRAAGRPGASATSKRSRPSAMPAPRALI